MEEITDRFAKGTYPLQFFCKSQNCIFLNVLIKEKEKVESLYAVSTEFITRIASFMSLGNL